MHGVARRLPGRLRPRLCRWITLLLLVAFHLVGVTPAAVASTVATPRTPAHVEVHGSYGLKHPAHPQNWDDPAVHGTDRSTTLVAASRRACDDSWRIGSAYGLPHNLVHSFYAIGQSTDGGAGTAVLVHNMGGPGIDSCPIGSLADLTLSHAQLEAKYKHAVDFGVKASRGSAAFSQFGKKVDAFVNARSTLRVVGTYRGNPAILNYNGASRLVVVQSPNGAFVTGFRMSEGQLQNVVARRSLGGG